MIGSNIEATRYSGIPTRTRHHADLRAVGRDVRVGRHHHDGAVQFGARRPRRILSADHRARLLPRRGEPVRRLRQGRFGLPRAHRSAAAVVGAQSLGRQPAPGHRHLGHLADRRHDPAVGCRAAQFHEDNDDEGFWCSYQHVDEWLDRGGRRAHRRRRSRNTISISSRSRWPIRIRCRCRRIPASCWRQTICRRSARLACPNVPGRRCDPKAAIDFLNVAIDKTADIGAPGAVRRNLWRHRRAHRRATDAGRTGQHRQRA